MKRALVFGLAAVAFTWSGSAGAEVGLAKSGGWIVTTDGRVNGFVSHLWGDDRPEGLESLPWVGFNETGDPGQADAEGKLRRTRIRSGYVPSVLALSLKRLQESGLNVVARVEIGLQIATIDPTFVANPTWMDPRSVYLDLSGNWGSVRVGRDFRLFSRGNLFMNYELGHAYGVGFPCAYEKIFGGACGHVGFGTLWPDFTAQITYTTPNFGDVFQVSAGIFDPRTVPTYSWTRVPLPRFEGEATAKYDFQRDWGVKGWVNGAYQQVGIGYNVVDPATNAVIRREETTQSAYGVGGGVIGYLGPVKLGGSGYTGRGMDGFEFLTFNPIFVSRDPGLPNEERRFRPTRGFLAEASVTMFSTTVMGGFGKAMFDRMDTDTPIETLNEPPLLRSQTGISAGVFHRIEQVVLGIDYFNARYGFDPRFFDDTTDAAPPAYVDSEQVVHIVSAGATLEW
jgi:hypothetical protein